jgi:hypothetical protein
MQPFGGIGLRTPRRYLKYAKKMRRSRGLRPPQRRGWRIAGKVVVGSAPKSASAPCEGFRFESIITKFPDRSELGYRLEVQTFFAALREGRTPTAGPEDAPGEATVGIGQAARLKTSGSSRMRTPEPRFGGVRSTSQSNQIHSSLAANVLAAT